MSVEAIIKARGIESVVHFTTNRGSLGVLASRALKSRKRLHSDDELKHIFQPNASNRNKDKDWLDYANLSITRINTAFFGASGSWHKEKDFFWCILEFCSEVMVHDGVWFTTTNNIYTGVKRDDTPEALEAMFAPSITQWSGRVVERPHNYPVNLPTCSQAEVLYPGELSTKYLKKIYVRADSEIDEIAAQIAAVDHPAVEIEVKPELFVEIK